MIATAVLVAQYAGTFDVLDTTRIGVRATQPPPVVTTTNSGLSTQGKDVLSADVSTIVTARLGLRGRRWQYSLTYSPTLTVAGVELGFNPQTFHTGLASISWNDRFLRVTASEAAAYGQYNSAFLYAQPTLPGQPTVPQAAPAPTTIDFGSSNTAIAANLRVERRTTFAVSAAYMVTGGLTTRAKGVLPEQYGPRGDVAVTNALSRRDSLATSLAASEVTTSGACPGQQSSSQQPNAISFCKEEASTLQLLETWRHQLAAASTLSLNIGVAAWLVEAPTVGKEAAILPSGGGSFVTRFRGGKSDFILSASMNPYADARTGLVSNRIQATAAVSDRPSSSVGVRYTVGAIKSVAFPTSDPYPLTALTGGIETRIRQGRQLDLVLGADAFWQYQPGLDPTVSTIVSAVGYVGVTARAPTLHF